jgi:hypothetical protein
MAYSGIAVHRHRDWTSYGADGGICDYRIWIGSPHNLFDISPIELKRGQQQRQEPQAHDIGLKGFFS